jgi:hypothetical protein
MPRKVIPAGFALLGRHRRLVLVAAFSVVLAGIVLAAASGSGGGTSGKAFPGGIARASSSGTASSSLVSGTQDTSFGPNVGTGIYQGVSPAVSSLPVLPVKTPTSITPRDIEALKTVGSPSNVKDPVVRSKKGSGPISGPIQNFDGACLPFGPPCEQPSGCSCLPPDTNGEVGATQYVQMVNTDLPTPARAHRRR